ncbi:hypothetical protein DFH09DRAFT_1330214 [Mycena vulgaris]|nr:hypothetical protein DFH09DRAFT_1330214 [Mycena vulgaris]
MHSLRPHHPPVILAFSGPPLSSTPPASPPPYKHRLGAPTSANNPVPRRCNNIVQAHTLRDRLLGALCECAYHLKHWELKNGNGKPFDTFAAHLLQIRILEDVPTVAPMLMGGGLMLLAIFIAAAPVAAAILAAPAVLPVLAPVAAAALPAPSPGIPVALAPGVVLVASGSAAPLMGSGRKHMASGAAAEGSASNKDKDGKNGEPTV